MALSSLLRYLGITLLCFAGVFFLIGIARTTEHRRAGATQSTKNQDDDDLRRATLVRRADWQCSAGLLAVALVAFATSFMGRGTFFDQPSGNVAGAVVLIVALATIILISTLIVRYLSLSRALRDYDHKRRNQYR